MKGRHLLLSFLKLSLCFIVSSISAQDVFIFSAEDNETLIGVEVWDDNNSFSAVSDHNGMVNISNWNQESHLNFRSLGFEQLKLSYEDISNSAFSLFMSVAEIDLDEVVIFGRHKYDSDDIAVAIESIKPTQINKTNPQTAADALGQHSQVYIQKSQMGGGSPVIRGFEANRVLLVIDGIRLNNAIYRSGHLQNAISVDPAVMNRIDVIYGANSLMYGSDALGGVVHFQTKMPSFSSSDQIVSEGNYYLRTSTANNEKSIHGDLSFSNSRWSSLSSITYSDFGDLRSGNNRPAEYPDFGKRLFYQDIIDGREDVVRINEDPNLQNGTAYSQIDVLQKIGVKLSKNSTLQFNFQVSTTSDVPRYDNLSEERDDGLPRYAEWYYGPQTRILSALTYDYFEVHKWFDNLKIVLAHQRIDEDRVNRIWGVDQRLRQEEDVNVVSTSVDFSKWLDPKEFRFDYGFDVQNNKVTSDAISTNVNSSVISPNALTRYANGANDLINLGSYITLSKLGRTINWNVGLRYSISDYYLKYEQTPIVDWPQELLDGVRGNNNALTSSASITYHNDKGLKTDFLISTAFRSPNIDDLSKIRVNGAEISFPNLELKPERSFNLEWSMSKKVTSYTIQSSIFITRLFDAIVRQGFTTPTGASTYENFGETLQVVANQNVEEALLYGWSLAGYYTFSPAFKVSGSYNWLKGRRIVEGLENEPFSHIPPAYGQLSLQYQNRSWDISLISRFNRSKSIEDYGGSVDNPEFATAEGALAWNTINVYSSYHIIDKLSLSFAVENIFDLHYRPFASGVSAPGRNISITLRGRF